MAWRRAAGRDADGFRRTDEDRRHWGVSNLDADDIDELAWLLRQPEMLVIPRASSLAHVRENCAALQLKLTANDLAELDEAFPRPTRKCPLEML